VHQDLISELEPVEMEHVKFAQAVLIRVKLDSSFAHPAQPLSTKLVLPKFLVPNLQKNANKGVQLENILMKRLNFVKVVDMDPINLRKDSSVVNFAVSAKQPVQQMQFLN
jgi:hypothetical protein